MINQKRIVRSRIHKEKVESNLLANNRRKQQVSKKYENSMSKKNLQRLNQIAYNQFLWEEHALQRTP